MNKEIEVFEREMLGQSLRELFFELNLEKEERFQEIKNKFLESNIEMEGDGELSVETVLVSKDSAFKMEGAFFPVVSKSGTEMDIFSEDYENIYLENIYLNVEYRKIEEIEGREFQAWMNINGENHEVKVVLEKDDRYFQEIRRLYEAFVLNGRAWRTLNMAHFMRCYRIRLAEYEFEMSEDILEKILDGECELTYEFEEYEDKFLMNMDLLWNIEKKKVISTIFVRPSKVDISFEYTINFEDGEQILVSGHGNDDILCCYYGGKNKLNIISKKNDETVWDIFSVKSPEKCQKIMEVHKRNDQNYKNYFHFTNIKKISFIDKIQNKNKKARSRAFLEKYFLEYDFTRNDIVLKDLNFEKTVDENIKIYDCNANLKNDFERMCLGKKVNMNLFVEIKKFDEYSEDRISFLISEIQNGFEEFECRGYLYGE